jgi:hypothetical protein
MDDVQLGGDLASIAAMCPGDHSEGLLAVGAPAPRWGWWTGMEMGFGNVVVDDSSTEWDGVAGWCWYLLAEDAVQARQAVNRAAAAAATAAATAAAAAPATAVAGQVGKKKLIYIECV